MKKHILPFFLVLISISGFSQVLNEGFESGTFPPVTPGNWMVFQNGFGSNAWTTNTAIPHAGTTAAEINSRQNIGIGNTSKDFLATPLVTIPLNGQLRFWSRSKVNGNQGTKYQIRIASGAVPANQTDETAYTTLVQEWTEDQLSAVYNVYEEKIVNLNAFVGQSVYIAFVDEYTQPGGGLSGDSWLLDDVLLITQCLDPTTLNADTITDTSANLTWANPGGASSFEIENMLASATPTGIPTGTSPTNNYLQTGLTGLTNYKYYVRAVCSFSSSLWVGPFTYTTQAAPPICGGNYVDSGGIAGDYNNSEDFTTSTITIYPVTIGDKVTVTFTSFDTEDNWDGLYVFDGNSTSAPQIASANPAGNVPEGLPGSYWGTTIPGPFTSTAADGSLTFAFSSDSSATEAGWIANVTCAPPPTCVSPTTLNTTTITSSSIMVGWTQPLNPDSSQATAWEALALPCGSPLPTSTSTGFVTAGTNPFDITGLIAGQCYDIYVRAVCSPTDSSGWSIAVSAITLPGCGGFFYDAGGSVDNYPNSSDFATSTITIYPTVPGELVTVTFTSFNTEDTYDGLYVFDGNSTAAPQIASANPAGNVPEGLPGSYWGNTIPGPFTSSAADGSLTFAFSSDGSVNEPGWAATVTCAPPPTCVKPNLLTTNSITQTSVSLGWNQNLNPDGSQASSWQVLVLPCGSPLPTAGTTGWTATTSNPFVFSGLTSATCYDFYVRAVCSPTDSSIWSTPKSFQTLIVNDECFGSVFIPVNENTNCLQTIAGTIAGATPSSPANSCGGTEDDDDVWFHFVATNTTHYVSLLDATDFLNYAIYAGTDCGALTQINTCVTENGGVESGLIIGQTYYVRVYSPGTSITPATFEICIGTNSGTCPTALPLCAINPIIFPNNVGVPSTAGSTGCLGSAPSPTYYYLQIPTNGNYSFFIEQNTNSTFTGTGLDVDFVSWGPYSSNAVACATINQSNTLPAPEGCSFSAAPTENFTLNGTIAGEVYVLMITNFTASSLPGERGFIRITQTGGPIPTVCCPYTNFSYSASFFCKDGANIFPTLTSGATAGTYSSNNPGLVIDPVTGEINLVASTVGNYTISNTVTASGTCPASVSTWNITISNPSSATISYSSASFCSSDSTMQTITQTGTTGGTYSVSPSTGLSFNSATGSFTPSTSTLGDYVVNYTIPAASGCPAVIATTTVGIVTQPVATFNYDATTYCQSGANPILTYTGGGTAGTFTSASGLSINSSTGAITLSTSSPGNYTITNTINASGGCGGASTTFDITISTALVGDFSYINSPYCQNTSNPLPTFSGGGIAGTFSSTTGLVIDPSTGLVNLTASTAGTYTVTNFISGTGGCSDVTATATITITTVPQATIAYASTYCSTDIAQTVVLTGTIGGSFSATPSGLTIDTSTGTINPSTSTAGTYVITYTIPSSGGCSGVTATATVTISPAIAIAIDDECQGSKYVLTATPVSGSFDPSTATYEWSGPSGYTFGPSSVPSVEIQGLPTGIYNVIVTFNGCSSTQNFTVDNTTCTIQKGISPNGDGNNEAFILSDVKKINIFNRYGTKVYSFSNYTNQWHGQSDKGEELPDGTYFYVFERNTGETITGWIYINR